MKKYLLSGLIMSAIFLLVLSIVFFACKKSERLPKQVETKAQNSTLHGETLARMGDDEVLNQILETEDYQRYVENFQPGLGELDFTTATFTHTEEGSYVTISSNLFVGESAIPKAQFQFSYDDSTLGIGIVIDYSETNVTADGQFIEGSYSINFPIGWELCRIIKHSDGTKEIQDGEDMDAIGDHIDGSNSLSSSVATPCYYGYVRYCYNTSKAQCEADPDCSFYCDFLPCDTIRLTQCSLRGLKACHIFGNG